MSERYPGSQPYSGTFPRVALQIIHLTERELEVLKCAALGYSAKKTAEEIGISKRTVDFHRANIYCKLQVGSVMQAVIRGREQKLID